MALPSFNVMDIANIFVIAVLADDVVSQLYTTPYNGIFGLPD
jgi:hypothetical protein